MPTALSLALAENAAAVVDTGIVVVTGKNGYAIEAYKLRGGTIRIELTPDSS